VADNPSLGRFVSATGQFLLATNRQSSCPPMGNSQCPLTDCDCDAEWSDYQYGFAAWIPATRSPSLERLDQDDPSRASLQRLLDLLNSDGDAAMARLRELRDETAPGDSG
jgi:hypothetical protein